MPHIVSTKCRFSPPSLDFLLKRAGLLFAALLLLFIANPASAQILIAGTSFDAKPGNETRAYIGMNDIVQYGFQTGSITVMPPITPSANPDIFNSTFYHAVTDNPNNLDKTRYKDLTAAPDYQLVISPAPASQTTLLTYKVNGLAPGTAVQVKVTYCSVISPTYAGCTQGEIVSLRGVINPDQYNTKNGLEGTQVSAGGTNAGGCTTLTVSQTSSNSNPVGANGEATFYLNTQQMGTCKAVGISKIEIYGTPKPQIISAAGLEVCAGEQVTLQTSQDYNGTYKYQVSTNNGSSWSDISTSAGAKSALYEALTAQKYMFRVVVTPTSGGSAITSDPITVNAITCCTINGAPASRQTIYYDDFGTLDLAADKTGKTYKVWDYTDPLNPKQVTKTTTTPFRWQLSPAPLGAVFSPGTPGTPSPIEDGYYTVAGYITGYSAYNGVNGAMLGWAARVTGPTNTPNPEIYYDHSGTVEGGALFLNCPPNTLGETLYDRTITNLCFGKQLFFECWIAVFTNGATNGYNPVNVMVRLTDTQNPGTPVTATATATRQADGGGVWVRVGAQITLSSANSTLKMEIINNQNVSVDGNDLVLDDIKIMACAPPPLDLYFDLATLSQSTAICHEATLPLYTKPSVLLKNYYGGSPMYLYQWTRTPNDYTSWKNLDTPISAEQTSISNPKTSPPFSGLPDGGKVYFRVIAATSGIYTTKNNFTAPNYANINDPCKNYSVSEAIEATVNCPLPVELVSFSGTREGGANVLRWTTSMEKNNHYFLIERSTNGETFEAIGRVEGKGTTSGYESYTFYDNLPSNGINYYRLRQVDYNGQYSYSKTIVLNNRDTDLTVYPNPNQGSFTINIIAPDQGYKLDICDVQGQVVYSSEGATVPSSIQVNHLPSGFYMMRLYLDNQVITRKIEVF